MTTSINSEQENVPVLKAIYLVKMIGKLTRKCRTASQVIFAQGWKAIQKDALIAIQIEQSVNENREQRHRHDWCRDRSLIR